MAKVAKDVDEYIAMAPEDTRAKLSQLRSIIRVAVPEAKEVISYKMPYYQHHGAIGGFAVYKKHIGFFGTVPAEYMEEAKDYFSGKGTLRLPLDEPLPVELIKKLVKARMKRNEDRGR